MNSTSAMNLRQQLIFITLNIVRLWSRWQESNLLPWICNPVPVQLVPPTFISGTACRNRTHIRRVEAYCIVHYTNAVWCGWRDSNPQIMNFKSIAYTNSATSAISWYPEWDSNSQNFSFWERRLSQFVHRGTGGLTVNWTQTQWIMSSLLYH